MESLVSILVPIPSKQGHSAKNMLEISFEPIMSNSLSKLPHKTLKDFLEQYEIMRTNPKKACRFLETFKASHPEVPEAFNLLIFIYLRLRKLKKAEALIRESYEKHTDYLFAKINYADQCLRKNKAHLIPEIFNHRLDLRSLDRNKKTFHFSEFRGFQTTLGFYYLAIGKRNEAEDCYHLAMRIDPLHSSVKILERKLFKISIAKKTFKCLLAFFQKRKMLLPFSSTAKDR